MRITEAAQRLGTSPRMLRYREMLGLLPPVRGPVREPVRGPVREPARGPVGGPARGPVGGPARGPVGGPARGPVGGPARGPAGEQGQPRAPRSRAGRGPGHRQFRDEDLSAVALALDIERRRAISPAELAFGLRVLAEPAIRAEVAELGRRIGRIPPPPGRALEFEKERALRLLSMGQRPAPRPR